MEPQLIFYVPVVELKVLRAQQEPFRPEDALHLFHEFASLGAALLYADSAFTLRRKH